MARDVSIQILRLFETRLENDPNVSEATVKTLLTEQREKDFGDDEELLTELVAAMEDDP